VSLREAPPRESRWLALALPFFPVEVARRISPGLAGRPLALVERKGGSLYVRAASLEALEAGVRTGSTHAHALAACPELAVRERSEADERDALLALARWVSFAIAPRPGIDLARHSVLVDVTGTELVHGSEPGLVARALEDLRGFGHEARAAIAATPLAALALACEGTLEANLSPRGACGAAGFASRNSRWVIAPPGETVRALRPLSPRALGLAADLLGTLAELGIRTLDELLRLPRSSLPARFPSLLATLERSLGERPHELEPVSFPEEVRERLAFEGGTDRFEDLVAALEELARRVLARFAAEGRAPRALELVFERELPGPERVSILPLELAAPVGTLEGLRGILRERLERFDLAHPVVSLELRVLEAATLRERQGLLFSARDASSSGEDLAVLLARLEGRLGPERVVRAELVPDHRPERAFVYVPTSGDRRSRKDLSKERPAPPAGARPARVFRRPIPLTVEVDPRGSPRRFRFRGQDQAVARAQGPERLETGFWDGAEIRRDYWILSGEDGRELWVFEELAMGRWFLHGVFE
jgi:protein ImuB